MSRFAVPIGCLLVFTVALAWSVASSGTKYSHAAEQSADEIADKTRDADIKMLKDRTPDQAHAMVSVAYHFNNMWFAAEVKNWPLAEFYWNETRSHLRWSVRIIPVRKDTAGQDIKLEEILQAVENSPLKQLKEAIDAKDSEKFVAAYRFTLESCYSCHKAADKPYLRPRIPEHPAEPSINFDPKATWPL